MQGPTLFWLFLLSIHPSWRIWKTDRVPVSLSFMPTLYALPIDSSGGSSLLIKHGMSIDIYKQPSNEFTVKAVYTSRDYHPYAKKRDSEIKGCPEGQHIHFHAYKNLVIFNRQEIPYGSGTPYKVFKVYNYATLAVTECYSLYWQASA